MNSQNTKTFDILLVEDNSADARLIKEFLGETDAVNKLHIQHDGMKAMEYLNQCKEDDYYPQLVLLDLNLPRKGGIEVLKEIKGDKDLRKLPVIILTTSTAREDIKECYDNYANCYITKPVEFDEFANTIDLVKNFWLNMAVLPK